MKTNSKLVAYYAGRAGDIQKMSFIEFAVRVQSDAAIVNNYKKVKRLKVVYL